VTGSDRSRGIGRQLIRGANRGILSTGDFATNIQADVVNVYDPPTPITLVEAPPGFSSLPAPGDFVGRRDELDRLDEILSGGDRAAVIYGLGGRGKSSLAAEWARRRWTRPVRWIAADSAARVQAGLAALASALEIHAVPLGTAALSERAIQWLDSHPGWLIILDNVVHPQDVDELVARLRGRGTFVVTTLRPSGWTDLFEVLPLDDLPETESMELLQRRAGLAVAPGERDHAEAVELCAELGHLPLALEQAAAYIAESGISVGEYRRLLSTHPAETFAAHAEGVESARTISRLWSLTLDRIDDTPQAADLLRILSWLDGSAVSREVIAALEPDPFVAAEAVRRLAAYSLLRHGPQGDVSVHNVVQLVYRTPDSSDRHRDGALIRRALRAALEALFALVPEEDADMPETWPRWRILMPHIEVLARHAEGTPSEPIALILNAAGTYAASQGQAALAVQMLEAAVAQLREVGGRTHPLTLMCQNNLANAREDAGDLVGAVALHEETLDARVSALGDQHPDTLASRANLASAYEASGDLGRAMPLLARVLAERERVLGVDHRHTWLSRNNLAYAHGSNGEPAKALPLFEQLLSDRLHHLGSRHVDTIITRHNIAQVLADVGELEHASEQIEQALALSVDVTGTDSLLTMGIHDTIGHIRDAQGRWVEALKSRKLALALRESRLGDDHVETMTSRNNLAHTFELAGNAARAVRLHERTLEDRERVLGPDHPHTLVSRNNVGNAYEASGDLRRAIRVLEFAVAEYERVLGSVHPSSLNARVSHAYARLRGGELPRALTLYEELLRDYIVVYGEGDERTKTMLDNAQSIREALQRGSRGSGSRLDRTL
jgi:tetratricopeptide (TPR) repeat protein